MAIVDGQLHLRLGDDHVLSVACQWIDNLVPLSADSIELTSFHLESDAALPWAIAATPLIVTMKLQAASAEQSDKASGDQASMKA